MGLGCELTISVNKDVDIDKNRKVFFSSFINSIWKGDEFNERLIVISDEVRIL